jgi:hypothetical protein
MEAQPYEKVNLAPLYVEGKRRYKAVLAVLVGIARGRKHGLTVAKAAKKYRVKPETIEKYCSAYINSGRW